MYMLIRCWPWMTVVKVSGCPGSAIPAGLDQIKLDRNEPQPDPQYQVIKALVSSSGIWHLAPVNTVASYDELFRVINLSNNRPRKAVHQLAISYMGLTYFIPASGSRNPHLLILP
jgi:hypothetical protein